MTETTDDAVGATGDAPGDGASADDGVVLTEPTAAPPRRSKVGTAMRWGGVAAGVAGIVLAVLGVLAFSSASNDDDTADAVKRRTKALAAEERDAEGNTVEVLADGKKISDALEAVDDASARLLDAQYRFVDGITVAVGHSDNGRAGDARAAFEAQRPVLAEMEQRLADLQAELAAAHEQLAGLSAGGGS